jgi:hypothetical protein
MAAPIHHTTPAKPVPDPNANQLLYDVLNWYYIGGAELCVTLVGANAFTAYSCRVKDDTRTVTWFFTTEADGGDIDALDFGALDNFHPGHNVGYGAYTGTKWSLATHFQDAADPDGIGDRVRLAINVGHPFMHFRYSVPASFSAAPYLSITAHTWLGIAPTTTRFAGGCPWHTIPLSLPAWASFVRSRGASGVDEESARATTVQRAVTKITSSPSTSKVAAAMGDANVQRLMSNAARKSTAEPTALSRVASVVGPVAKAVLGAATAGIGPALIDGVGSLFRKEQPVVAAGRAALTRSFKHGGNAWVSPADLVAGGFLKPRYAQKTV